MIEPLLEVIEELTEEDRRWVVNIAYQPHRVLTVDEKQRLIKLYDQFFGYGVEQ